MSDDTTNRGAQDRHRINMHQDHEVRYWTEHFGVSRDELQAAVDAAGPVASAVEQRLRSGRGRTQRGLNR
jgi:Protein of unknown function (DUF3606)